MSARLWDLAAGVVFFAACLVISMSLTGCGGGAVRDHATAATIASVGLSGAAHVATAGAEADVRALCPDTDDDISDRACVGRARERWAPVAMAHEAARVALVAWVEALDVAEQAAEGEDLARALAASAARFVLQWDALAEAMRAHGVVVPDLPLIVRQVATIVGGYTP